MNKIITRIFTICLTTALLSTCVIDASSSAQSSNSSSSYASYINKWTIGGTLAAIGVTFGTWWYLKSGRTNQSGSTSRRPSKDANGPASSPHLSPSSAAPSTSTAPQNAPHTSSSEMIPYQPQTQLTVSSSSQGLICNTQPVTFEKAAQQQSWAGWVFSPFTGKPTPEKFFQAVHERQHNKVIRMIEAQADINWQADNGLTPVHIATYNNDMVMMSILTKNRQEPLVEEALNRHGDNHYRIAPADFFKVDNTGSSALHVACQNGNKGIVDIITKSLRDSQQLVNKQNTLGHAALHVAARYGHAHLIDTLVRAKGDVNSQTHAGATPLAIATRHGHNNVIAALQPYQKDMKQDNFLHDKEMFDMIKRNTQGEQNSKNSPTTSVPRLEQPSSATGQMSLINEENYAE